MAMVTTKSCNAIISKKVYSQKTGNVFDTLPTTYHPTVIKNTSKDNYNSIMSKKNEIEKKQYTQLDNNGWKL